MSNMIRRSIDTAGQHVSPLNQGVTDVAANGLGVRLLKYPDEQTFKRMVYKATTATRGNDIQADDWDPVVVEEAFRGGLNQCLEWDTVVFEISGVSRGLTHEIVRTRKASFAQQSMRHTDMGREFNVRMPEEIWADHRLLLVDANKYPLLRGLLLREGQWNQDKTAVETTGARVWQEAMRVAREAYGWLVENDFPYQDSRTVCPIATETYIIAEYPISEFLNTYAYRACHMFYPEIVALFGRMGRELAAACPWLAPHILISCEKTRPNGAHAHMCTYQGWERVEGHCPLAWAVESNRVFKSSKFEN